MSEMMEHLSNASKHAIRHVLGRSLILVLSESGIAFLPCLDGELAQAPPIFFLTDVRGLSSAIRHTSTTNSLHWLVLKIMFKELDLALTCIGQPLRKVEAVCNGVLLVKR